MAISLRKIKGHTYAYRVTREGARLIQTYLGRADSAAVQQELQALRERQNLPGSISQLFWETSSARIEPSRHATAIISKVLEFGDLKSLRWIERRYGRARIEKVLAAGKGLSPRTIGFFRLWFGLEPTT